MERWSDLTRRLETAISEVKEKPEEREVSLGLLEEILAAMKQGKREKPYLPREIEIAKAKARRDILHILRIYDTGSVLADIEITALSNILGWQNYSDEGCAYENAVDFLWLSRRISDTGKRLLLELAEKNQAGGDAR